MRARELLVLCTMYTYVFFRKFLLHISMLKSSYVYSWLNTDGIYIRDYSRRHLQKIQNYHHFNIFGRIRDKNVNIIFTVRYLRFVVGRYFSFKFVNHFLIYSIWKLIIKNLKFFKLFSKNSETKSFNAKK